MKTVLIVDADQRFLLRLKELLKPHAASFRAIFTTSGKQALKLFQSQPVDLLVTSLNLPQMDGFQLVSQMNRLGRAVPVIATAAFGSPPAMEERILRLGAFLYLEKPFAAKLLIAKIQEGLQAGGKGYVRGISLPSLLQLLELDQKTCTLTARASNRAGLLFFQDGTLTDACTESREGLDAAFEIIGWEASEIEFHNFCKNRKRTIDVPLGFILIESARLSDEEKEQQTRESERCATVGDLEPLDELSLATTLPPRLQIPSEFIDNLILLLAQEKGGNEGRTPRTAACGSGIRPKKAGVADPIQSRALATCVAMAAEKLRALLAQAGGKEGLSPMGSAAQLPESP